MKTKLSPKAIHILALVLAIAGTVLLVFSILDKGDWYLTAALAAITFANLLNFFATRKKNRDNEKQS